MSICIYVHLALSVHWTMGNTRCGSVVVIAIDNAHTPDDATDSLSLRSFYGKNYVLL